MNTSLKRHSASLTISIIVLAIAASITYSVNKPQVTCAQAVEDVSLVARQPWSTHEQKNKFRNKADRACRFEKFQKWM